MGQQDSKEEEDINNAEFDDLEQLAFEMNQVGLERFYPIVFIDFQKSLMQLAKHMDDNPFISFANLENPKDKQAAFNPYEDALKLLAYMDIAFKHQLKKVCEHHKEYKGDERSFLDHLDDTVDASIQNATDLQVSQTTAYSNTTMNTMTEVKHEHLQKRNIPVYRFGCSETGNHSVLPVGDNETVKSFSELYKMMMDKEMLSKIYLGGPISFYPLIQKAIDYAEQIKRDEQQLFKDGQYVKQVGELVICFVLTNGCSSTPIIDHEYIMRACNYPIIFVFITIGKEQDQNLDEFDNMHYRKVDNVNYIHLPEMFEEAMEEERKMEREFKWEGKLLFFELLKSLFQYKHHVLEQCSKPEQEASVEFEDDEEEIVENQEEEGKLKELEQKIQNKKKQQKEEKKKKHLENKIQQSQQKSLQEGGKVEDSIEEADKDSITLMQVLDVHNMAVETLIDEAESEQDEEIELERERKEKKERIVEVKKDQILQFDKEDSADIIEEKQSLQQGVKLEADQQIVCQNLEQHFNRFWPIFNQLYTSQQSQQVMQKTMSILQNSKAYRNINALEQELEIQREKMATHSIETLEHFSAFEELFKQCSTVSKQLDLSMSEYRDIILYGQKKGFVKMELVVSFLKNQFLDLLLQEIRKAKLLFMMKDEQIENVMKLLESFNICLKDEISASYSKDLNVGQDQISQRTPTYLEIVQGQFQMREIIRQPLVSGFIQKNRTINTLAHAALLKSKQELDEQIRRENGGADELFEEKHTEKKAENKPRDRVEFRPSSANLLHMTLFANTTVQVFEESEGFEDVYAAQLQKMKFKIVNQLPISQELDDVNDDEKNEEQFLKTCQVPRNETVGLEKETKVDQKSPMFQSAKEQKQNVEDKSVVTSTCQLLLSEKQNVTFVPKRRPLHGQDKPGTAEAEASMIYLLFLYQSEGKKFIKSVDEAKELYSKNKDLTQQLIQDRAEKQIDILNEEVKQWRKNYDGKSFTEEQQRRCIQEYLQVKDKIGQLEGRVEEVDKLHTELSDLLLRAFNEAQLLRNAVIQELNARLVISSNMLKSVGVDDSLVDVVRIVNEFEISGLQQIRDGYQSACTKIKKDVLAVRQKHDPSVADEDEQVAQMSTFAQEIKLLSSYYKNRRLLNTTTVALNQMQSLLDNRHVASADSSAERIQKVLYEMQMEQVHKHTYEEMLKEVMSEIPDSFRHLMRNSAIKVFNNKYLNENGQKNDDVVELDAFEHVEKFDYQFQAKK